MNPKTIDKVDVTIETFNTLVFLKAKMFKKLAINPLLLILLFHSATPKPAQHFLSKSKAVYGSRSYIHICKNNFSRLKFYIALDSEKSESKMRMRDRRRIKWNQRITKICCFTVCNNDDEREIRVIMDYNRDYRRHTIKQLTRRFGGSSRG